MTPGRPEPPRLFVARPRVTAFLDAVPSTPVSVMVAPAGTGKTAAAAYWTARRPDADRITWLDFRPRPAGPLGTPLEGDQAPTLELLESQGPAASPPPIVIVDDAQTLDGEVVARLAGLLSRSPDTQRLLLLSRVELPFIPVALALAGRVNTLAFPELRFDDSEADALVRAHHPEASAEQVRTVLAHSDGWAAALVLGARSLHGRAEPPPLTGMAPQPMLDYLSSEVIDTFSPSLRQVLTSICQETDVTAEDAVVLSGESDAADLLAAAAADGLMVTSYRSESSPGGRLWRLHPLLVEVLRRRTSPNGPDWSIVANAHARAALHHSRVGNAAPAVRHATLTGDLVTHLEMLQEFAPELLARNQAGLVRDALNLVPAELRESDRDLQALDALVLREQGLVDAAKRVADRALSRPVRAAMARGDRASARDLEVDLAILEVWQARCGWRPRAAAADRAARALHCRHDVGGSAVDENDFGHDTSGVSPVRSAWLMHELAAMQVWTGDLHAAGVHLEFAARYAEGASITRLTCAVLSMQAVLNVAYGAYQTGARLAEDCLRVHDEAGFHDSTISARAHLMRGWGRFHALDLDGAISDLTAFLTSSHDPFAPIPRLYGRLLQANILTAHGNIDRARMILDDDSDLSEPLPAFAERHKSLARFRAAGFEGDLAAMEVQARNLLAAGFDLDAALAHAVTRGLGGDETQAIRDLDQLLTDPRPELTDDAIELPRVTSASAAVSRVAFLLRIGTPEAVDRAASLVPDMLTRIAPQKLLWLLSTGLLVTPRFTDVLVAEVARPGGHPFAAEALEALRAHPRPFPDQTPHHVRPGDVRAGGPDRHGLTARELEVLRALTLGYSNAAIARSLFVSENTVKTHLAAVYRKLGVSGRREALEAARRDGLL